MLEDGLFDASFRPISLGPLLAAAEELLGIHKCGAEEEEAHPQETTDTTGQDKQDREKSKEEQDGSGLEGDEDNKVSPTEEEDEEAAAEEGEVQIVGEYSENPEQDPVRVVSEVEDIEVVLVSECVRVSAPYMQCCPLPCHSVLASRMAMRATVSMGRLSILCRKTRPTISLPQTQTCSPAPRRVLKARPTLPIQGRLLTSSRLLSNSLRRALLLLREPVNPPTPPLGRARF